MTRACSSSRVSTPFLKVLMGLALLLLATTFAAAEMTPAQASELAAIRAAIDSAGAHWVAAPNEISLMPREDYTRMLGGGWPPEVQAVFDTLRPKAEDLARSYPSYWDWREMDGTTPVRSQGSCGSCWDFAAVGALEGNLRINEGVSYNLSEQQGLDCNEGGSSCDGGWQGHAYAVFTDPGAVSEQCMPYIATESTCRQRLCEKVAIMDGYQWVSGNVSSYKAALMEGPLSACYTVYEDFDEYSGGCYQHVWGSAEAGHCVTIVGWDDSMCGGDGAWICKNSWGSGWGEGGYFYIKFGDSGIGSGAERPLNAHIPRERFVPDQFASIQSAIDNSERGDIIRVAGGTYNESVVVDDYRKIYGGYDSTFQIRDLDVYPTVIDAGGSGHAVTIAGQENVVVDGFEIRNAAGAGDCGIYMMSSEAIIRNCDIHNSYRGISVDGSNSDAEILISRCEVRDNADHGIYLGDQYYESLMVQWTASYGNGGDGVHSNPSNASFQYCTFAANDGDGIDLRWTGSNRITSSIICSNGGYGIYCMTSVPSNDFNCVWGNAAGDYLDCSPGAASLNEDPILCDAEGGDVRVHAASPTLGAAEFADDMGALGIGCPVGPTNLAVAQNGASLELAWDPPAWTRAPVDHYVIYRDTTLFHSTAVGTVEAPATSFTDITIPPCVVHNFWVSAVDTDTLESAVSNRRYSEVCYEGPDDLAVEFHAGGNELEWSPGVGDIVRYEIMRSTIADPADSVGSVIVPTTSFVDVGISACPRDNYIYQVVPIYGTGWRGDPTEAVEVDPAPAPPTGLTAERVGLDVTLSWSPSCESDFRKYWVYRDTMPLTPPPEFDCLVGQTVNTTYVDEGVNPDWNYFYRLAASDASFKKSGYSNMAYVAEPVSRTVPGQFATIQAAIDASSPPDTVLVGPGTYSESIVLKDGVIVMSEDGPAATTITHPSGSVVKTIMVCDLTSLDGFTIDGQGSAAYGLEAWSSYVRVSGCTFQNCSSGVGVKYGGSPELSGSLFTGNQYGVAVSDSAAPRILSNTFDSNSFAAVTSSGAPGPEIGGALSVANDFANMGLLYIHNTGTAELGAEYNYWGDVCPDPVWFNGQVSYSPWTDATHTEVLTQCTGVPESGIGVARVGHNFPNPFNPMTSIRYEVPAAGTPVDVVVYDLAGRTVRTLVSEVQSQGEHVAVWMGRDDDEREVASGVYFYRVKIGGYLAERKMLLLK